MEIQTFILEMNNLALKSFKLKLDISNFKWILRANDWSFQLNTFQVGDISNFRTWIGFTKTCQPIESHRVINSNFENSSEKPFLDKMKLVWINGLNASQLQHKEIVQMVKTCRKEIYLGCNRFDGVEIDDLDFDLTE